LEVEEGPQLVRGEGLGVICILRRSIPGRAPLGDGVSANGPTTELPEPLPRRRGTHGFWERISLVLILVVISPVILAFLVLVVVFVPFVALGKWVRKTRGQSKEIRGTEDGARRPLASEETPKGTAELWPEEAEGRATAPVKPHAVRLRCLVHGMKTDGVVARLLGDVFPGEAVQAELAVAGDSQQVDRLASALTLQGLAPRTSRGLLLVRTRSGEQLVRSWQSSSPCALLAWVWLHGDEVRVEAIGAGCAMYFDCGGSDNTALDLLPAGLGERLIVLEDFAEGAVLVVLDSVRDALIAKLREKGWILQPTRPPPVND
jgi:hypothetical protein